MAALGFSNTKLKINVRKSAEINRTNIAIQVNGINALDSNADLTYGVKYVITSGDEKLLKKAKTTTDIDTASTLGLFVV